MIVNSSVLEEATSLEAIKTIAQQSKKKNV
jgi:hypothetical protein